MDQTSAHRSLAIDYIYTCIYNLWFSPREAADSNFKAISIAQVEL